MHTVVLGNGILALTIAFRLAQRSAASETITLIGKKTREGSATLAAGAMLNSFAEIEAGSLQSEIDLYRFELSHLATRMWPKFEKELIAAAGARLPPGCAKCEGCSGGGCFAAGTYVVNNAAADDLDDENFDAMVAALEQFDEPFERVSPRDIPNYMPEQKKRATRAVYLQNEGWFNPRLMVEKLDAALAGDPRVSVMDGCIERLLKCGETVDAVELEGGQVVSGDRFVIATGASLSDLLAKSRLDIGVQRVFYGVGMSVEIRSPDYPHTKVIRTPNRGLACGLYSVPYFVGPDVANDHILIGASNFIAPTPQPRGRLTSVEALVRGAIEEINANFYRAELVRVNVGWRPTSQDGYPLLGRTSIANLIIASGTKRDGFHMSPLISQNIVSLLCGEPVDERFNWFAPERTPIRSLTREQAIAKAVRHQVSAAYQHGFTPSQGRMTEQIARRHRDDLERLHDQVGAIDWGIPPEMLDMYRYGHCA